MGTTETMTHYRLPPSKAWEADPYRSLGHSLRAAVLLHGRESQTVTVLSYIRSIIVPLSFMLVFYANYSVLIDHFLFAKRPWKYFLYNVVLIAFRDGSRASDIRTAPASRWEHPRPERESGAGKR